MLWHPYRWWCPAVGHASLPSATFHPPSPGLSLEHCSVRVSSHFHVWSTVEETSIWLLVALQQWDAPSQKSSSLPVQPASHLQITRHASDISPWVPKALSSHISLSEAPPETPPTFSCMSRECDTVAALFQAFLTTVLFQLLFVTVEVLA